jgi:hypothetical protein
MSDPTKNETKPSELEGCLFIAWGLSPVVLTPLIFVGVPGGILALILFPLILYPWSVRLLASVEHHKARKYVSASGITLLASLVNILIAFGGCAACSGAIMSGI